MHLICVCKIDHGSHSIFSCGWMSCKNLLVKFGCASFWQFCPFLFIVPVFQVLCSGAIFWCVWQFFSSSQTLQVLCSGVFGSPSYGSLVLLALAVANTQALDGFVSPLMALYFASLQWLICSQPWWLHNG